MAIENFALVKKNFKDNLVRHFLKEFAEKLLEVTRETDIIAVLEDGLFGILIPETDYYGSLMLIKRIKVALYSASFSLDLKREFQPVISLGSANYPSDGEQLITLLRCARERLAADRNSLASRLELGAKNFWQAFSLLNPQATEPPPSGAGRNLLLSDGELDQIRNLFLDEAGRSGSKRGLIYIGAQQLGGADFYYPNLARLANSKVSVYALGFKGESPWNHPEIMPVYLNDEQIRQHRFLLCLCENFYYTCLCRPEGTGRWRVFHSADSSLALEMVSKLQERYFLQRRIG
jgi:GGDEF domain-containing protein